MTIFDANAYFAARAAQGNLTDKFSALEKASAEKTQALEEHRLLSQQRTEQKAAEQALVDASWSGKLKLESGGFLGNRVNEAASFVSGASRMAGQITSLVPNALAYADTGLATTADTEAWNRAKTGQALPEDAAVLDRLSDAESTVRQRFERAEANHKTAANMAEFFNLDKIVDPTNRNELTKDLKKGFEEPWAQLSTGVGAIGDGSILSGTANAVSGLAKLLVNTGAALLSNPTGVKEYVIENVPQFFSGALGVAGKASMFASNAGYAADMYRQGLDNYAKENGGALPPLEERQNMARNAALLMVAEQASDVVGLSAAGFGKKAAQETADAVRTGFKASLKNIGKATATGAASEAPTEGVQTYLEGEITGKPTSAADIYTGAVIGGASGGSLSGGGRAVAEALAPAPESAAAIQEKANAASTKALVDEAIKTGDVSSLLDAPQRAIGALIGNSQLADTTPEQKQANLVKADEILASLDTARAEAQSAVEKTTVAGTQKAIDTRKAQLADLDAADPENAPKVSALTSMIEMLGEQLTSLQADPKAAEAAARIAQANLSKVERDLKKATETYGLLKNLVNPATAETETSITNKPVEQLTADDVAQMMRAADTDTSPEKEAVSKVITLAMRSPESLDATQVANLVNNASNGLSTEQRTFLRVVSEARLAQNALRTMDMVSSEVMNGSADNKGIVTYAKEIGEALVTGNTKKASRSMEGLQAFAVTHASKAAAAQEALATGPGTQIVRSVDGVWSIPTTPLTPEALKANGGLSMDTPKLVEAIKAESAALNKTVEGMEAAFVIAGKKGTGNVTNQPQQAAGAAKTQVAPATPAKASTPTAVPAPVGGTVPGAVPGTGNSTVQPVKQGSAPTDAPWFNTPIQGVSEAEAAALQTYWDAKGKPTKKFNSLKVAHQQAINKVVEKLSANAQKVANKMKFVLETGANRGMTYLRQSVIGINFDALNDASKWHSSMSKSVRLAWTVAHELGHVQDADTKPKFNLSRAWAAEVYWANDAGEPSLLDEFKAHAANTGSLAKWIVDYPLEVHQINPEAAAKEFVAQLLALHDYNESTFNELFPKNAAWLRSTFGKGQTDGAPAADAGRVGGNAQGSGRTAGIVRPAGETKPGQPFQKVVAAQPAGASNVVTGPKEAPIDTAPDKLPWEAAAPAPVIDSTQQTVAPAVDEQTTTDTVEGSKEPKDSITAENSTDQNTESTESAEQTSEDTTETEEESSKAVLSILSRVSEAGASFLDRVRNTTLIGDFFTQRASTNARAKNPLTTQEDFLSAWQEDPRLAEQFIALDKDAELTEQQQRALNHMKSKLVAWSARLKENFIWDTKVQDEYRTRDMMQFFVFQGDGGLDVDENVKTAMAFSAYQWAVLKASSPASQTPDQVLHMHGKEKGSYLSPKGHKELRHMVGFEDRVISDLGKATIRALGLVPTSKAPKDLLPKLESAFGSHVLAMMEKEGLIDRGTIPAKEVRSYFVDGAVDSDFDASGEEQADPAGELQEDREVFSYVKLLRNNDRFYSLSAPLAAIKDANKGTRDVINKVFGEQDAPRFATTEPVRFVQKFAKKTKQRISKMQRRVIQQTMGTPHTAIPEMLGLMHAMGRNAVLKMAGWVELSEGPFHEANLYAIEAQNQNLEHQYDLMMEMLDNPENPDGYDTEFFVQQEVWKNFRAGFVTQSLNQQTSKIHRYAFTRPSWKTTIDLNNRELVNIFKVAVAQAIGVNIDRQVNEKTVEILEDRLSNNSPLSQAIGVISRSLKNTDGLSLSPEETTLITDAAVGAEGMQTMQAMVAYAKYLNAVQEQQASGGNKTTFEVSMLVGADGKTNGPMLTHLALGAAGSVRELYEVLRRGGMYSTDEGDAQHYSEWYSRPGSMDLYENLTSWTLDAASKFVSTLENIKSLHKNKSHKEAFKLFTLEQWGAFELLTKELSSGDKITSAGRNIAKTPITAFGFGSALSKAVAGMENKFISGLYDTIQDIAQNNRKGMTAKDFVKAVNKLIETGDYKAPGLPYLSSDELLKLEFNKAQEAALRTAFMRLLGEPTKQAMRTEFAPLMGQRNTLNKGIQGTFSIYHWVMKAARAKEMDRLMDAGEIAFRIGTKGSYEGVRVPLHDMSQEQESAFMARFKAMLPTMHTDYSLAENDSEGGLFMAKLKNLPNTTTLYAADVRLRTGIGGAGGRMKKSMRSSPITAQEESPGVAGTAYFIHSLDSAGIHKAMAAVPEAMNVHDEVGTGVGLINKAASAINKGIAESLLDFSPAEQTLGTFTRLVVETARLLKEGAVGPRVVGAMFEDWADIINKGVREELHISPEVAGATMLTTVFDTAISADKVRLGSLAKMAVMDQYPWEGGSFTVTEEFRNKAALKLKNLPTEPSAKLQEAMKYLEEVFALDDVAYRKERQEAKAAKEPSGNAVDLDAADLQTPTNSPYGKLGTPGIAADKDLEAFFKQNPETTAERVIRGLYFRYRDDKSLPNREFTMSLLNAIDKVVDPAMPVRYITAKTPADAVLEVPENASRGWYSVNGTAEEINVLSFEFAASGLTPELLVHELVHSALLQAMRSGNPEVQPFIDNLNKLMGKAESYAKTNDLFEKHKAAFENLDEFVTWGMTNPDFQKEVLSQFYMKPADGTKTLVTALQDFIKNITNMLFLQFRKADGKDLRTSVGKNVNGMAILINDVMQVMEKAANNRQSGVTATVSMASRINDYSTQDIHRALDDGKISHGFQEHLSNLLGNVTAKLHGPFGAFLESIKSGQAISPMDVWTKALDTGVAPFASKILVSGFVVSQQEAFAIEQVEATVRAALDGNEANTKFAYKELATLYMEAKRKLPVQKFHGKDWATATQTERDNAQALHDFVFALEKGNGDRMDYLSRFAALGLAHEGFNKLLQMSTDVEQGRISKAKGLANKLQAVFESILEFFSSKITHTYGGQRADAKLTTLVAKLVDIEAKKRHRLAMDAAKAANGPTSSIVDKATDGARNAVVGVLNSSFIKKSSFRLVRGAGAVGRMVAEDRVAQFMEAVGDLRDKMNEGRPGLVGGVFNVVRGPKETMEAMVRVAKGYEGHRKDVITAATKAVAQSFNKTLNREQKAGITRVFLRTGAHVLVDQMGLPDIEKLLSDPKALASAITRAENALSAFPQYQHYFKAQANALAYAKVGRDAGGFTMMNARNIAFMAGTVHKGKLSGNDLKQATKSIETLVALYAIDYSPSVDRNLASELMRDELQRTDGGNGIEFTLKLHKRLEQDSRERLFQGQEALMMHGFTSEILNPHVEVLTAYVADEKDLLDQGYVKVGPVEYDAADPDTDAKAMYVLKDGGLSPYQSGAISISSKKAKGSKKHSGYLNINHAEGTMNASTNAEIMNAKQAEIAAMFKPAPRKNMAAVKGAKLTPVLNAQGDVVNWRYLMSEKNKDTLLDRTNNFDSILGAVAGSIYDKSTTQEQNSKVLQTLKEVYDADVARNPDSFINIGPKSKDKEMAEIWDMLPKETKATAISIFGLDGIQVRKDAVDLTFGYRKASLASLFDKENRKLLEELFVNTVEGLLTLYAYAKGKRGQEARDYAKRAAVVVTKSERMWQSLVQETKDIIVVKTGTVLLGNIWSNLSLLVLKGVPLKDMVHHHSVALRGATSYMGDTQELDRLRLLIQSDYAGTEPGGKKGIEERILVLEDAIARNPVRELIEAGLMPSIVEDVAAEEDPYSYKSLLVRKMESVTSGVPQPLISAAKTVYMSKDGAMYRALYRTTQLSDFVARYTLYQHLISREKNPLSKEAALFEASESFVNYDLPMPKTLQYMDDMGIMPFMKYFLNIQRVIQKTAKENPVRVLSAIALGNVMDLGPIVLSSAAITRIGNNPVQEGAIKFFGSLDDLATTNAAMSLIK